jgi:hypothetical protein
LTKELSAQFKKLWWNVKGIVHNMIKVVGRDGRYPCIRINYYVFKNPQCANLGIPRPKFLYNAAWKINPARLIKPPWSSEYF